MSLPNVGMTPRKMASLFDRTPREAAEAEMRERLLKAARQLGSRATFSSVGRLCGVKRETVRKYFRTVDNLRREAAK